MKLLARSSIVTLLVFLLSMVVHAEPVSQLHPTGYVNDFAHVLDPKTVAQMETICLQIDQKAHAQIAVVTINSLDGAEVVGRLSGQAGPDASHVCIRKTCGGSSAV
jgi:uncharacterized protein